MTREGACVCVREGARINAMHVSINHYPTNVLSWYSHGGVQDDICHKVASCEGKTTARISGDGYASSTL